MKVLGTSRRKGSLPAGIEEVALARPVRTQRCHRGLLRADRRDPRHGQPRSASAGCKPIAVLVNVSRGAVIETPALIDALRSQKIGGAALDVFDVQPLPANDAAVRLSEPAADAAHRGDHRHQRPRDGGRLSRGNASYPARRSSRSISSIPPTRRHEVSPCALHRSRPSRSPTACPRARTSGSASAAPSSATRCW